MLVGEWDYTVGSLGGCDRSGVGAVLGPGATEGRPRRIERETGPLIHTVTQGNTGL
jgi:hypothetical protein